MYCFFFLITFLFLSTLKMKVSAHCDKNSRKKFAYNSTDYKQFEIIMFGAYIAHIEIPVQCYNTSELL